MGEQRVSLLDNRKQRKKFIKNLLNDVKGLEYMLTNDWFEKDIIRIGAEQEMVMVDTKSFKPAMIAMKAMEEMKDHAWVETELARFNLEANLTPYEFTGKALSKLENETLAYIKTVRKSISKFGADVLLTGVLPTLRKYDLTLDSLTPKKRYRALMDAIDEQLQGNAYELRIIGIDELMVQHDSPMMEACNTSFQVHLQVTPGSFVKMYNIAQALAGPVIAIGANSPIVFGKRLWHETRIALFQQALDTRASVDHMRERSPRVSFGKGWLDNSILDIYKEDIARFRVLIAGEVEEDSLKMIKKKKVPKLRALQVHNSTVYRWNRPCYGVSSNGMPHLRIENRVLPSGPTVVDEIANSALWLGAMIGLAHKYDDIRDHLLWEDVRDNFGKAARFGIDSSFNWFDDRKISATDLILNELIPLARKGLKIQKVAKSDIDKYLGIIEERAKLHMTGARWQLRTFTKLKQEVTDDEAIAIMTAAMLENQRKNKPVHTWEMPETSYLKEYLPTKLKVEEVMEVDLFTVRKEDIIELVADLMKWKNVKQMLVEDKGGNLDGLITYHNLFDFYEQQKIGASKAVTVGDIMIKNPVTIHPEASIVEAVRLLRKHKIESLPVVKGKELVGMVSDKELFKISGRMLERLDD